jgi:hypothetical protein
MDQQRSAGVAAFLAVLFLSACSPPIGGQSRALSSPSPQAICNHGTYVHIPGDFPEFGPPQTLYVGTTPSGHGSVFRVGAQADSVIYFYANGAGQVNYVFYVQSEAPNTALLLWREQSDFKCRGTLAIQPDPADADYTIYSVEPSTAAYSFPSTTP